MMSLHLEQEVMSLQPASLLPEFCPLGPLARRLPAGSETDYNLVRSSPSPRFDQKGERRHCEPKKLPNGERSVEGERATLEAQGALSHGGCEI